MREDVKIAGRARIGKVDVRDEVDVLTFKAHSDADRAMIAAISGALFYGKYPKLLKEIYRSSKQALKSIENNRTIER